MPACRVPSIQKWHQSKNLRAATAVHLSATWPGSLGLTVTQPKWLQPPPVTWRGTSQESFLIPPGGYQILPQLNTTVNLTRIYIKLI